jgi:hypothetical protein
LHAQKGEVYHVFKGRSVVVHGHGFVAALLGAPTAMVNHLVGVGLANTARSVVLDVAVAAPMVQPHRVIEESNETAE